MHCLTKTQNFSVSEILFSLKRKEVLTPATTWMSPEDIMPSEMSQAQRDNYWYDSEHKGPREVELIEAERGRWWSGAGGSQWGLGHLACNGHRVAIWRLKFWRRRTGMAAQQCSRA